MQIMLDRPSLQSSGRKLSFAQLGEIAALHKALYAGLHNISYYGLNYCFSVHLTLLGLTVSSLGFPVSNLSGLKFPAACWVDSPFRSPSFPHVFSGNPGECSDWTPDGNIRG